MHVLLLSFELGGCVQSTSIPDVEAYHRVDDDDKHSFPLPTPRPPLCKERKLEGCSVRRSRDVGGT